MGERSVDEIYNSLFIIDFLKTNGLNIFLSANMY
jgi:hypothetical protein